MNRFLKLVRPCFLATCAALLAGCASVVYDGKYDWKEGWREARVERTGSAEELGGRASRDCRYRLPPEEVKSGRFAVLGFEYMARHRHRVVPLAPGDEPARGEPVLTNLRRCEPPTRRAAG
jgi:hypothetical protein